MALSKSLKPNRIGTIVVLLKERNPLAIIRGVISEWVYALNREPAFWSRSHISVEVLKGINPTFMNSDALPSISRIAGFIFVVAAPLDRTPCQILN